MPFLVIKIDPHMIFRLRHILINTCNVIVAKILSNRKRLRCIRKILCKLAKVNSIINHL